MSWHRIAVYLGLVDDPELLREWEAGRPDLLTTVVGFAVGAVGTIGGGTAVLLAVRALSGDDTDVGDAALDVLAFAWLGLIGVAAATAGVRRRHARTGRTGR